MLGADDPVYIDQSPGELRLNVVGGPLDLTQFTVLSSGRIAGARLQVRAGIIGASHVFAVHYVSLPELHEVFACRDLERTEAPARRLFSGGVGELPGQLECAPADGLEYRFRPQVADFESGARDLAILAARVRDAEGKRNQIGLAYTFPAAPDAPDLLSPRTVVWVGVDPDEGGICVETAHCYPNEQTIVFSETRIEIATESAR